MTPTQNTAERMFVSLDVRYNYRTYTVQYVEHCPHLVQLLPGATCTVIITLS